MFDIANKYKLAQEIKASLRYPNIDLNNGSSPKYEIERCIRECMESVVDNIIDHLYTVREFEDDIGLSDGNNRVGK